MYNLRVRNLVSSRLLSIVRDYECMWCEWLNKGFSQSQFQPQPTQPQPAHVLESNIWNAFMYVFPVLNCYYWQFGWILFYSRNIHINALAEAEPDIFRILWLSLSQNMKCPYFLNERLPVAIVNYGLNYLLHKI